MPPSAAAADASSPYEQAHHYHTRHPAAKPTVETRRRTARALEVERVNAHIQRRLAALRREPPARFHAPDADASLRPRARRGPKGPRSADRGSLSPSAARPAWDDGSSRPRDPLSENTVVPASRARSGAARNPPAVRAKPARSWPPPSRHVARPSLAEKHEMAASNASLQRRLAAQYDPGRDSQLVREGKGFPVDGHALWARRLRIYDASAVFAKPGARPAAVQDPATGKCVRTGVPKTLAMAKCAGSGAFAYYGADGRPMTEHPDHPGLFYCSEWYDAFARLDATMQRQMIAYHRARHDDPHNSRGTAWQPARPANESWVVNRHMKLALTLMRRLARDEDPGLTVDEVEERVGACKAREREEDRRRRAAQKEIDDMAAEERAAVRALREESEGEGEGGGERGEGSEGSGSKGGNRGEGPATRRAGTVRGDHRSEADTGASASASRRLSSKARALLEKSNDAGAPGSEGTRTGGERRSGEKTAEADEGKNVDAPSDPAP